MKEEPTNMLEKILQDCRSAEEKAIISIYPVLERDFTILYNLLKDCNLNFCVQDARGATADVAVKKGKLYIRQQHRSLPDYAISINQSTKGKVQIKMGYAYGINGGGLFGHDLLYFLQICGRLYTKRSDNVENRLKQIASLPAACIGYLQIVKENKTKADKFVEEITATSRKFVDSLEMVQVYYDNPNSFKAIFEKLDDNGKKKVLAGLIRQKKEVNEVDRWLDEKYSELIDKVGMERMYG